MCDIGLDLKQPIKLQIRVVKNRSYSGILLLPPSHVNTHLKTIFFSHFQPSQFTLEDPFLFRDRKYNSRRTNDTIFGN